MSNAGDAVEKLRSLEEGPRAFFSVLAFGAEAVPALLALLSGPTESVDQPRRLAAEALGIIGGPEATEALLEALDDSAARDAALPPVLREAESGVLSTIASALVQLREPRTISRLVAVLERRAHVGCLEALAAFGDLRAPELAARHLRDGVARLPAADVLRAFGRVAAPALGAALARRELVHDAEPPTWVQGRTTAVELLGELACGVSDPDARRDLVAPLVAALEDGSPEVRRAAALALTPLGPDLAAKAAPVLGRRP